MIGEPIEGFALKPPRPGDLVRTEILDVLGLSVTAAAEVLGVDRQALCELVNGDHKLSPEMALRIEKAFGVDMDSLLRIQAWYDSWQMRQKAGDIHVDPYGDV